MRFIFLFILLPSLAFALPDAPTNPAVVDKTSWVEDSTLPITIYDDNYEGWVCDVFLGNYGSKNNWYDGPRLEVGGSLNPWSLIQADDKIYYAFAPQSENVKNIVEIDETTGEARLLMHWTGKDVGDIEEVFGGDPFYGEDTLFLAGSNCVRKVVDDGDGTQSVELVAGECGTPCVSSCDGTGSAARFGQIKGWAAPGNGNIYVVEKYSGTGDDEGFKKIVISTGVVTTHELTRDSVNYEWNNPSFAYNVLSVGEDTNTLYFSDNYNTVLGKTISTINLTTYVATRVAGMLKSSTYDFKEGWESDGPALDHVGSVGGPRGIYSPFYSSYFIDNNDSLRMRRLTTEGGAPWVKTASLDLRPGSTAITFNQEVSFLGDVPGEQVKMSTAVVGSSVINQSVGVDDRGGIYMRWKQELNTVYRLYNPMEGGTE